MLCGRVRDAAPLKQSRMDEMMDLRARNDRHVAMMEGLDNPAAPHYIRRRCA